MAAILSQPQCVNIMQLHLIQMQKGSILILGIHGECHTEITNRAPFQYLMKHLVLKSHQVTKPWDWGFKSSHHLEIWQAHRQQCCWGASQVSEQLDNSKYESCAFKTLQDLTMKHIIGYWNRVQVAVHVMTRVLVARADQGSVKAPCQYRLAMGSINEGSDFSMHSATKFKCNFVVIDVVHSGIKMTGSYFSEFRWDEKCCNSLHEYKDYSKTHPLPQYAQMINFIPITKCSPKW